MCVDCQEVLGTMMSVRKVSHENVEGEEELEMVMGCRGFVASVRTSS